MPLRTVCIVKNESIDGMTFVEQTRLNISEKPHERGNCFPTVIACLMGLNDPELVFQVQEQYDHDQPSDPNNWANQLNNWLNEKKWHWTHLNGHRQDDKPYLVIGLSSRGVNHVCIYKKGEMIHDPFPGGEGLLTEDLFEYIAPFGD